MKENNKCADRPIENWSSSLIPRRRLQKVYLKQKKKKKTFKKKREVNEQGSVGVEKELTSLSFKIKGIKRKKPILRRITKWWIFINFSYHSPKPLRGKFCIRTKKVGIPMRSSSFIPTFLKKFMDELVRLNDSKKCTAIMRGQSD